MKKRMRDMTWEDYGISWNRRKELEAFCRQYDEKKSKINSNHKNKDIYIKDCMMIEEAAIKANPSIWKEIIESASKAIPFEYIEYNEQYGKIPIGKTDFYGYKRLFYKYLDDLQIGDKSNLLLLYNKSGD